MFKGLKKKIENDQKVGIGLSPGRIDSKPGGPVRVSSTSDDLDEISSIQARRETSTSRSPVEDKDNSELVRRDCINECKY